MEEIPKLEHGKRADEKRKVSGTGQVYQRLSDRKRRGGIPLHPATGSYEKRIAITGRGKVRRRKGWGGTSAKKWYEGVKRNDEHISRQRGKNSHRLQIEKLRRTEGKKL